MSWSMNSKCHWSSRLCLLPGLLFKALTTCMRDTQTMWWLSKFKTCISIRHIATNLPQDTPPGFQHTYPFVLVLFWKALESSLLNVFIQFDQNLQRLPVLRAICKTELVKNMTLCLCSPYSSGLVPYNLWLYPQIKMTMNRECFKETQDIKTVRSVQLKTWRKEHLQRGFRK